MLTLHFSSHIEIGKKDINIKQETHSLFLIENLIFLENLHLNQ